MQKLISLPEFCFSLVLASLFLAGLLSLRLKGIASFTGFTSFSTAG